MLGMCTGRHQDRNQLQELGVQNGLRVRVSGTMREETMSVRLVMALKYGHEPHASLWGWISRLIPPSPAPGLFLHEADCLQYSFAIGCWSNNREGKLHSVRKIENSPMWQLLDILAALIPLPVSVATSLINYCLLPTGLGHNFRLFAVAFQTASTNPLKMALKVKLISHTRFWVVSSTVPLRM